MSGDDWKAKYDELLKAYRKQERQIAALREALQEKTETDHVSSKKKTPDRMTKKEYRKKRKATDADRRWASRNWESQQASRSDVASGSTFQKRNQMESDSDAT